MKVPHIDSTLLGDPSVSRLLGREIGNAWRAASPELHARHRDLARDVRPQRTDAQAEAA